MSFMRSVIKNMGALILSALIFFGVGTLVADKLIMPLIVHKGSRIEVPDVVELSLAKADSLLQSHGFKLVVESEKHSPHVSSGCVISQNPTAFSTAKKGRSIYVVASKGKSLYVVPDVCGVSVREARLRLGQSGFDLGTVWEELSYSVPKGVVIHQNPAAGETVEGASAVAIVVSGGSGGSPRRAVSPPDSGKDMRQVPNVIGMFLSQAEIVINGTDLRVGDIREKASYDVAEEIVVLQSPEAYRWVSLGDSVNLVVSSGGGELHLDVPNMIGMDIEEAKAVLEKLGLKVGKIDYRNDDRYLPLTVTGHSPTAGEEIEPGGEVNLVVNPL